MFYSRLRDQKNFNATFKDEIIFYRCIMFTSVFYLITGTLPILVASIFGLIYVRFGYQLQMFCIEMIIVEVVLIILMSIELYKIRNHIISK
jgi:hypothetical protein